MVLGSGLREPDITSVSPELAGLERIGNILLDDDGTTGGVDEPRACTSSVLYVSHKAYETRLTLLHLADQILVEHATGLLVERAVDGDNITLREHLLKVIDAPAANVLLLLRSEGLVVVVEQLLAVECLQSAQHTLTDTADSDGTNNLVLEVVLVLGNSSDVTVTPRNLLVSRHEVANKDEDSHDHMLGDRDDVGASDLSNGDAAIGLVGSIQVNVVGPNAGGHGDLEVLGLCQALCGEISRVEAEILVSLFAVQPEILLDLRSRNDHLSINELLVELAVLALLVGGGDEGVALLLDPFPETKLVLGGS